MTDGNGAFRWLIVAAVFVVNMVAFGSVYAFGSFIPSLEAEFGSSRAGSALLFALSGAIYFSLGIISGPLADRIGARWLCRASMLMTAASLVGASRANTIEQLYLWLGGGLGLAVGMSFVPAMSLIQHWFETRKGLASGIAVSGIGAGTLVYPLLAAALIEQFGWRDAYLGLALVAVVVGFTATLLIADPKRHGLAHATSHLPGVTTRKAVSTIQFQSFFVAALLGSTVMFVPFVHLPAYAQDNGWTIAEAAGLVSLIGAGSMVGRLAFGGLGDRIGHGRAIAMMFGLMGTSFLFWLLGPQPWSLGLFAITFGTFYGGVVPLTPTVAVTLFGPRALGSILGVLYTSVAAGSLIGPPLAGWAYERASSYASTAWIAFFLCLIAAALCAVFLKGEVAQEQTE